MENGGDCVVYAVKCARCGAVVRLTKSKKCFEGNLMRSFDRFVKCKKCRCVVGEYGEDGKFGAWYGAEIERI